jgi:hypothetical protein
MLKNHYSVTEIDQKLNEIEQIWLDWKEKQLEMSSYESYRAQVDRLKKSTTTIDQMNANLFKFQRTKTRQKNEYQLFTFLSTMKADEDFASLFFWDDIVQKKSWSTLSQLAISVFSFSSMSDEAERIFSEARRTIFWERSRLQSDIIETTECAHHFLKAEISSYKALNLSFGS